MLRCPDKHDDVFVSNNVFSYYFLENKLAKFEIKVSVTEFSLQYILLQIQLFAQSPSLS